MRHRILLATLAILLLVAAEAVWCQTDWRIGFEYNEIGAWNLPKHDSLVLKR